MVKTYNEIQDQDPHAIDEGQFIRKLVCLLPYSDDWKVFHEQIKREVETAIESGSPLTYDDVIERIQEEEWDHKDQDPEHQAELLLTTTASLLKRKRPISGITANAAVTEKKARYDDRSKLVCTNEYCGSRKRHTRDNCFAYGGGKAGKYPDWWKGRHDIHLHPDKRSRTTMNESGELATKVAETNITRVICLTRLVGKQDEPECSHVTLSAGPKDTTLVYSDFVANRHIVFDRSLFTEYTPVDDIIIKGFDSTFTSKAAGVGTVEYIDTSGKGKPIVRLSDVLHIPLARLNIWSCGELEDQGVSHHTDGRGNISFALGAQTIATGKMGHNRLYRMHLKPTAHAGGGPVFIATSLIECLGPVMADAMATSSLADRIDNNRSLADRMTHISLDEVDFPTAY